ncbi:RNA polymerase sigma factor [Streptosporangium sp. NPDC003464]
MERLIPRRGHRLSQPRVLRRSGQKDRIAQPRRQPRRGPHRPGRRGVDAGARTPRLAEIADRDRDVLLLVAWAELTFEEAGSALGIPAGTARSRLHRARSQKMQAALERDGP